MAKPTAGDYGLMAGFVAHPHARSLMEKLGEVLVRRSAVRDRTQPPNLMVTGEAGSGKSWALKEFCDRNPLRPGKESDVRPVVYVEAPSPFAVGNLYQAIMEALEIPILRVRPSIEEKLRVTVENLSAQQVEMLIIDEMQNLRGNTALVAMDAMKHLANRSSASLVLAGPPAIEMYRNADEQYQRRFPIYRIERYERCDTEFVSLIMNIGKRFLFDPTSEWWAPKTGVPQAIHKATDGYMWKLMELFLWIKCTINPSMHPYNGPIPLEKLGEACEAWQRDLGERPSEVDPTPLNPSRSPKARPSGARLVPKAVVPERGQDAL